MDKKLRVLIVLSWFILWNAGEKIEAQSVGISASGTAPDNSSILDLSATNKGFLLPRMTETERDAISSPATGLQVFNTTDNCLQIYINGSWQNLFCDLNCSSAPSTPGTISGTTAQCENATGQAYSIAAVAGATSYNWTVPSGATITAGQGTTGIIVTFATTAGNVQVTASNNCGTSSAQTLAITLSAAPAITGHPANSAVSAGDNTTFSVTATGSGLSYQWQEDPNTGSFANISNGGTNPAYSNATTATLSLNNIPVGHDQYKYRCVVTNSCGSATSNSATLSVNSCPTWSDDFNTSDWTTSHAGDFSINGGTEVIDFSIKSGVNNGAGNPSRIYFDLQDAAALGSGNNASNTSWILRFRINWTTLNNQSAIHLGISSSTASDVSAQDFIGMTYRYDSGGATDYSYRNEPDDNVKVDISTNAKQAFQASTSTNYYVEVKRLSATSMSVEWFTNSDYSSGSLGLTTDNAIASTITGLRYIKFMNESDFTAGDASTMSGIIDDVQFCNGVTTW